MKHKKTIFVILFLAVLVLGYYYYLSNIKEDTPKETSAKATKVQEVLMRNLEIQYPPTPREIIRFFAEITKCLHNETYTDEESVEMSKQLQKLYDEDFLAVNPEDQYSEDLKTYIQSMKGKGYVIANYAVTESTDVEYYVHDGYDCARLHCVFYLREGTNALLPSDHYFVLRKDADGHWKIFGWQYIKNEEGK